MPNWLIFSEHKIYEPAFYSTVIQDWGSSYLAATALGSKAKCLVDLGHHAPTMNIEMIVARLIHADKLGGFHFNDSKYGDDDLDAGSVDPYRRFLVFNELVEAELEQGDAFRPAHMIDQSHNVTDPIESLMLSAIEIQRAYAAALIVDRAALHGFQYGNDALMAQALAQIRVPHRCLADPCHGKGEAWGGGASGPYLPQGRLSGSRSEGAPGGHRRGRGDRLRACPTRETDLRVKYSNGLWCGVYEAVTNRTGKACLSANP